MKTIAYLAALCFIVGGCSRKLPSGEHNHFHPNGIDHAILHLEFFGDVRGTEDVFTDSFGSREATDAHSALITEKGFRPTITYTIQDYGQVTIVDSIAHLNLKLIDHTIDSVYRLLPKDVPTFESEFRNAYSARGYTLAGDTTVLGLKAHVWRVSGTPNYVLEWRGLVVGSLDAIQGHEHELRLMSIDTTTPINPSRFLVPTGFPTQDLRNLKPGEKPPPPHF